MTDVKLELAKEEAAEAAWGIIRSHETSASVFLTVGLELEEQQYGVLSFILVYLVEWAIASHGMYKSALVFIQF